MEHAIRPALRGDLAALRAIVDAAYTPYVARIGRAPGPMLDDYGALVDAGRVHVVAHRGTVLGLLVLVPEEGALLIHNVAVAPAAQGTGLGRALLAFAEQTAREAGHDRARLYTNETMTENIGLYGRLGYAVTHRGEEGGFRRVYMEKRLEP